MAGLAAAREGWKSWPSFIDSAAEPRAWRAARRPAASYRELQRELAAFAPPSLTFILYTTPPSLSRNHAEI